MFFGQKKKNVFDLSLKLSFYPFLNIRLRCASSISCKDENLNECAQWPVEVYRTKITVVQFTLIPLKHQSIFNCVHYLSCRLAAATGDGGLAKDAANLARIVAGGVGSRIPVVATVFENAFDGVCRLLRNCRIFSL